MMASAACTDTESAGSSAAAGGGEVASGGAGQGGAGQGGAGQGGAGQGGAGQGGGVVGAGALAFYVNPNASDDDYAQIVDLPPTFGSGAFTFEIWVRLDGSLPTGPTAGTSTTNWSIDDPQPPADSAETAWWFSGNFLLDGHNNASVEGTFDLQIVGDGRVRWLFHDGNGLHGVQAWPSTSVPRLLDDMWHHIAAVRRFTLPNTADLELWVDGTLINTRTGVARVDMRTYWDTWGLFPADQPGWFFGAEKISATGGAYWDDYKGLIGEMRFWDMARSNTALQNYDAAVNGTESGLVGWYRLDEGTGMTTCDTQSIGGCIALNPTAQAIWSADGAPLVP